MMDHALLRLMCFLNRFSTMRHVRKAFRDVAPETWATRRLFGNAITLDVSRSEAQQLLLVEGERFVEERSVLRGLLRPGMCVVDVGANIGYYLMLFEQAVGQQGKVICIEPSVENLPELRRNIELNRFGNVQLHEVALGDEEGEVRLRSGINSGVVEGEIGGEYIVPLRRLDRLVEERVDFLKIDVEGYEGQVLAGAEGMLARDKPILFLELHPHIVGRFGYSVPRILADLARHYSSITLYEKNQSAAHSIWGKVAIRYFGRNALSVVHDVDAYVARYDSGEISHTYWAVCTP